ncbi:MULTISPECIES: rhomboid family intramembrane serine protease [Sphingomonas]|uniref:rhomboid family intramembrane serine protease n=1 Tax=Sphingomonas TaxID=13687 RepID=UPI000DEEBE2A|nr:MULTISPECIES: rhomboid family intramembrane serine protease [Sphingomonas]
MTLNWRSPTIAIAVVSSVISLLILLAGYGPLAAGAMGVVPARLSGVLQVSSALPAWLTPFSCTLVHGSLMHLLFNMLMLLLCGVAVERVLGAPGLVVIYLVSAVTSALAQWGYAPLSDVPVIGASGAISGVIGAYALSFGRPKQVSRNQSLNRLVHIVWLAVAWTLLQIGVGYAAGTEGLMVATPAHVGGFITGLLLQRPLLLWRYRKA